MLLLTTNIVYSICFYLEIIDYYLLRIQYMPGKIDEMEAWMIDPAKSSSLNVNKAKVVLRNMLSAKNIIRLPILGIKGQA